jgi:hypothetical protein
MSYIENKKSESLLNRIRKVTMKKLIFCDIGNVEKSRKKTGGCNMGSAAEQLQIESFLKLINLFTQPWEIDRLLADIEKFEESLQSKKTKEIKKPPQKLRIIK